VRPPTCSTPPVARNSRFLGFHQVVDRVWWPVWLCATVLPQPTVLRESTAKNLIGPLAIHLTFHQPPLEQQATKRITRNRKRQEFRERHVVVLKEAKQTRGEGNTAVPETINS